MATGAFFCLKQGGGADRLPGGHMKLDFHNSLNKFYEISNLAVWNVTDGIRGIGRNRFASLQSSYGRDAYLL